MSDMIDRLKIIRQIGNKAEVYYPTPTTKLIVSKYNNLISYNQCINHKWYKVRTYINDQGYLVYKVQLSRPDSNGKTTYNKYLHALVYHTVNKTKPQEGYHYVFKDGRKTNCHPSNLSYEPIGGTNEE